MMNLIFVWSALTLTLIHQSIGQDCREVGCKPGFCCSKSGFCGNTPAHCANAVTAERKTATTTIATTTKVAEKNVCKPPCRPNQCCSKWGSCGDSPLHCAGSQAQTNDTQDSRCKPPCRPNQCCSKWGSCGDSPLHCAGSQAQMNDTQGGTCEPPCGPGSCCSKWGFCGNSPLHCESNNVQQNTTFTNNCEPPCGPGSCCSKWGFCGNTPLHCEGNQNNGSYVNNCQPPCAPGSCCSRWGFCGNTPLHCEGHQNNGSFVGYCNPPCRAGFCCSRWGFCGDTPLHCAGGLNDSSIVPCEPPCRAGLCCSRWGFCGDTPLHCAISGITNPPQISTTVIEDLRCPPPCPAGQCCSKWGFCGVGAGYCEGQTPNGQTNDTLINEAEFNCIFDQIDASLRGKRWQGLQDALAMVPFKPQTEEEMMMFIAHVSHETDGLKTLQEYCGQSGTCADDYNESWCSPVEPIPGKHYYGRGWFQLSWPCNYNAAGNALGFDLLENPDQVASSEKLAAATALWFWNENNMGEPARAGNFAATTQIINKIECGPTSQQNFRIERYQKVRQCFGLAKQTDNLQC